MRRALSVALCAALLGAGPLGAQSAEDVVPLSGKQIMERTHSNWSRYDSAAVIRLELVSPSGRKMERRLEALRMHVDGQARTLVRLLYPEELRGTTLLVLENPERDDDRFLYLPVTRKVRRISAGQREDRVLGTDFSYEDLGAGDLEAYTHTRLADGEVEGIPCFVVRTESIDKLPRPRVWTSWVSRAEFVPLRVEYERFGRPSRRLEADHASIEQLGPQAWLPRRVVMHNLIRRTRTELRVESLQTELALDPSRLSLSYLETLSRRDLLEDEEDGETEAR